MKPTVILEMGPDCEITALAVRQASLTAGLDQENHLNIELAAGVALVHIGLDDPVLIYDHLPPDLDAMLDHLQCRAAAHVGFETGVAFLVRTFLSHATIDA